MSKLRRINRATYWLAVIVIFLACYGVSLAMHRPFQGTPFLLAIVAVPRLHDFNKSGLWALGVVVLEMAAGILLALQPQFMQTGVIAIVLVTVALIVLAGCVPGNPRPNRYGQQPAGGISYGAP